MIQQLCRHCNIDTFSMMFALTPKSFNTIHALDNTSDHQVIEAMIAMGFPFSKKAMINAVSRKDMEIAKRFLGLYPFTIRGGLGAAFRIAIERGHMDMVQHLWGVMGRPRHWAIRAINCAARYGHISIIEYFYSLYPKFSLRPSNAVGNAILSGDPNVVKLLLNHGAQRHVGRMEESQFIQNTLYYGRQDLVHALLACGNLVNSYYGKQTSLDNMITHNFVDLYQRIYDMVYPNQVGVWSPSVAVLNHMTRTNSSNSPTLDFLESVDILVRPDSLPNLMKRASEMGNQRASSGVDQCVSSLY
ncbi:hypothetical protein SAMD00019534_048330 [Acytostelium subglobosum LB1]|uniref:hypothetical protein n=1 Tax=Acytostelium subglobosum LB1 TaxID=1410327 RepID=UPI00064486AE|nr:hypothetical protein SAMD00019534_048330 [Acytostelium subglobosum LB1]GAM21658.1 hypothetical protein SAMD00019534_048330 [Acytostelium subglobosum LB1]|eukprot:XP_012755777.1 hypothetical protein SAMD00019534_048330 [Acytostelium subglobosum LB1]